jgi:hypothetical protein
VTGRRLGLTIGLGLAACLLLGRVAAGWLVEFRWYEAMGASSVFWVTAGNLLLLRGAAFVAGTLLCFANFYAVRFSIVSVVLPRRVGNLEIAEELHGRTLAITVLVLSVILGGLLSLPQGDWVSLDLVRHGETFRESDPYFGFDLAFWVYWLPIEESFHAWATLALLVVTGVVLALYALTPSLRWEQGRLRATGHVRRHMFVLVSLLLLLLAWSYRLDALGLLLDGEGSGRAFLALDHRVGIPTRLVLAMACVVTAMLVAWAGWVGAYRPAGAALARQPVHGPCRPRTPRTALSGDPRGVFTACVSRGRTRSGRQPQGGGVPRRPARHCRLGHGGDTALGQSLERLGSRDGNRGVDAGRGAPDRTPGATRRGPGSRRSPDDRAASSGLGRGRRTPPPGGAKR